MSYTVRIKYKIEDEYIPNKIEHVDSVIVHEDNTVTIIGDGFEYIVSPDNWATILKVED